MTKEIEIKTPIWASKSVGVNISDCTPDTIISVTISYKNKDGKLIYPHKYELLAKTVFNYPKQKIKGGTEVHIVPIKDFIIVPDSSNPPSSQKSFADDIIH